MIIAIGRKIRFERLQDLFFYRYILLAIFVFQTIMEMQEKQGK